MGKKLISKETVKILVLGLFIVMMIVVSYVFDLHQRFSFNEVKEFIASTGLWGPVVFMLIYIATSLVFFPATLLSTVSGALWGPYLGTFYTVIIATISAIFPFMIARGLGKSFVEKMIHGTKLNVCDNFLSRNGFFSVLIMRLIPLFPWDMVNYGIGICNVRFRDYFFATLIGIIPASFTYNLIGSSVGEPLSTEKIVLISSLVIILALVTYIFRKHLQK